MKTSVTEMHAVCNNGVCVGFVTKLAQVLTHVDHRVDGSSVSETIGSNALMSSKTYGVRLVECEIRLNLKPNT